MSNLSHRQQKIQEKRKQTSWRDFVMEIGSWIPISLYNVQHKISRYPASPRIGTLYSTEIFFEERGNDSQIYDTKKPFFSQLEKHFQSGALPAIWHYLPCQNAQYADTAGGVADSYLSFLSSVECRNIFYSFVTRNSVVDTYNSVYVINNCANIYQSLGISSSQNIFYSKYISNSSHLWFCTNMVGCHDCLYCDSLENASYCIDNKQLSNDVYKIRKKELLAKKEFFDASYKALEKKGHNIGSNNSIGSYLLECENLECARASAHIKQGRNVILSGGSDTCEYAYDSIQGIQYNHAYATAGIGMGEHFYCCVHLVGSYMFYSTLCRNCSYCLGCIGLNNKQFCIFNKQYTKEERHDTVDKIFMNMEEEGTLGDFFPGTMNPFYFNDTAAYLLHDNFTKQEIEAKGYLRRDEAVNVDIPEGVEVIQTCELGKYEGRDVGIRSGMSVDIESVGTEFLPSAGSSRHIDPSILKKVIQDEQGNVYRIIQMEYDFLMKHALPLPRLHRLDRLKTNVAL